MKSPRKWSLIEVRDHTGVLNVGGRIGAALGPAAFRAEFARQRGEPSLHDFKAVHSVFEPSRMDLAKALKDGAIQIANAHSESGISVVVGGGHDWGYAQLLALRSARLGCLNIDAHLDVRAPSPLITSGSPYFLAIEENILKPARFVEFGIQPQCNAPTLQEYARKKKIEVIPLSKTRGGKAVARFQAALRKLAPKCDRIVLSLDLDAIAEAYAPGVSAPSAEGFTPNEVCEMMEMAGKNPKVISLGIFELNPLHDRDGQTARLAATCAWRFLAAKFGVL